MPTPRVFISYSHDSEAHDEAVLRLAQKLRTGGIDAQLDRFVPSPEEGWPRWMMAEVDGADLVILVCTSTFRRRFEGQEAPESGRGVTFEGMLAIQHLYDANTRNTKFIPVVFEGAGDAVVPLVLRPYTRYQLPQQFDLLYRRLTDQPDVVAAPLGPRRVMPPRGMPPLITEVHSGGAGDVSLTPHEALHHLVLGLFGSGENFRRWVALGPDGSRLVAEFPGATASSATMVAGGLDVLSRFGYLDDSFFVRLAIEFSRRNTDIARVAAAWGASSSPSPRAAAAPVTYGGIHFGSVSAGVKIQARGDIIAGDKHITISTGPARTIGEARRALEALRRALLASGVEPQKLGRALDDAADELAAVSPDRGELANVLARILRILDRAAPDLRATFEVANPLDTLFTWLGPKGDKLRG